MELCCTKSMLDKLGEVASDTRDLTGLLTYWTCKPVVHERKRYILALNKETMLALLVPGAPQKTLRDRLADALEDGLKRFGVAQDVRDMEVALMRAASFSKNRDRSLLGSLNDLASHAPFYMERDFDGAIDSLHDIAHKITNTPHCNRKPVWAKDSIAEIFTRT